MHSWWESVLKRSAGVAVSVCVIVASGCADAFLNQTASLGGDTAGERGTIEIVFINNTPHRALFTAGTYDHTDADTVPQFVQFGGSSPLRVLQGNAASETLELPCARLLSIGGEALADLVRETASEDDFDEDALLTGVGFSSAPAGDADADVPDAGFAAAQTFLLGADFPCNALVVIRLEVNDAGPEPFLITMSFIPSESTR
ncbi:MAG: hypothetical protein BroJett003_27200 [Planctomycetota bacterium]|nr:MAG: hypothetical protein BroJett003_27200 [Planctomycetota bacterium]